VGEELTAADNAQRVIADIGALLSSSNDSNASTGYCVTRAT